MTCPRLLWTLGLAICMRADEPLVIYDPLPEPLKLPPGLVQTLPLHHAASFFGEAIRAVDCADPKDQVYGLCENQLFGGLIMGESRLTGSIRIRFNPPVNNVSHFQVEHGTLHGDDSELQAPLGYVLPVLAAQVVDAPDVVSSGDLDLLTGGVSNLQYAVISSDSAVDALVASNPGIGRVTIRFPGARGHAYARFDQRPDGLLDYTFRGSTFLPLGGGTPGEPLRFPLPLCPPGARCADIPARGSALHPHLYLSTRAPDGDGCAPNCPDIPVNTIRQFTVFSHSSSFGDDFDLDIPQLGGSAGGRSHLQGRLQIQFGPRSGDLVPFVITSLVPEGLFAKPPDSAILGAGPAPGLIGQEEFLQFPLLTYRLERVVFVDEPYNFTHGAVDLRTGRVIGDMVYPSFYGQSLADALFLLNAPRISKDPFFLIARRPNPGQPPTTYALFEKGPNGETVFRFSGEHKRSFATYLFPTPELRADRGFVSGPAGTLDLFLRLQAMHTSDTPTVRKEGAASEVLSSVGDRFSYSYSIPCDPAGVRFAFEYTNRNTGAAGGTFRMNRLASVSCTNSRTSNLRAGDYDTVTFSGFGAWSKDPADSDPRFATVQVSTNPDYPYVGILVYQNPDAESDVVLSSANTRPKEKPLP